MTGNGFRPPVTLRGRYLDLVPLSREHVPGLVEASQDPEVWRYLRIGPGHPPSVSEMDQFVGQLLAFQDEGNVLAEVMLLRPSTTPIGIIRFLDIDRSNRMVEVGTWLDSRYWGSPLNTDAKLAMLTYAFEEEQVHRVQFKTDARNERSQRAIVRLGAVPEGALREAHLLKSGRYRTSLYYSILASEWPAVKGTLEAKISVPWDRPPPSRESPKGSGSSPSASAGTL